MERSAPPMQLPRTHPSRRSPVLGCHSAERLLVLAYQLLDAIQKLLDAKGFS
jgi:hypothetical protein